MKIRELLEASVIEPSTEPGTMSLWHGGDLTRDITNQKRGRMEYGPGLYLTTHYDTAKKYAKGSRKLYMITIRKGNDDRTRIPAEAAIQFVKQYAVKSKQKDIVYSLEKYTKEDGVPAYILINNIVNHEALKPTYSEIFRQFLVRNGVDYSEVPSPFGWGETMIVLFNMGLVVSKTIVAPSDKIVQYDLPTAWI